MSMSFVQLRIAAHWPCEAAQIFSLTSLSVAIDKHEGARKMKHQAHFSTCQESLQCKLLLLLLNARRVTCQVRCVITGPMDTPMKAACLCSTCSSRPATPTCHR